MLRIICCLLLCFVGCTSDSDDDKGRSACGDLQRSALTRIIDGSDCPVVGSPVVQLTLLTESGNVGLCSGTIIHPQYVLTAAHCYLETNQGPVIDSSVRVEGFDYLVEEVFLHPRENVPQNDIAIVKLEDRVLMAPVPLYLSKPVETDLRISIFGYGFDEDNNFANLKSGDMVVTGVTSQNVFARFDGRRGSNVCFGDSGGPALTKGEDGQLGIVGVTSFATSAGCVDDSFAAFANTQGIEILDFILDVVPSVQTN